MARRKKRPAEAPVLPTNGPIDPPSGRIRVGVVELVGIAMILVTGIDAWASRYFLNPDGVSYLDLVQRLLAGDGAGFVQGYWSPLYPALIAVVATVGGDSPAALLSTAHLLNGLAIIGAIILVWWWSRQEGGPLFARAALAALFLVSSRLPRIEAVTPDILHLALMTWLGYELLVARGARWGRTGILLGAIYLAKTSAWPWLILSIPLRLWGARDAKGRADVLRSVPVTFAVILLWVVPMTIEAGHPTFGSAGRLNYCWYINACDSRTPDQHVGRHVAYREAAVDSARSITWAEFDADHWTYAPWSDPTAWEAGVITRNVSAPTGGELVRYWGRLAHRTFTLWLLPVLAGVLLPWAFFEWRPERRRWWVGEGRPALAVVLLGLAGIIQFILIHAEPRLLAPYGMLLALGVLHRGTGGGADAVGAISGARQVAGWLGLLLVAGFGYPKVMDDVESGRQWDRLVAQLATTNAEMAADGLSQARVVVLGPGIPAEAGAFLSGSRIIAQVLPSSADLLDGLAPPCNAADAA